ncbi:hypothetical protein BJ170DRAFT_678622 [Xylariales sp. AK1849]|nr:hypothetical protein BJ170DRAFT_678622 [Xylariales sp. AK1849]
MLLTIDALCMAFGTLKADNFSETHMYNPNWPPHANLVVGLLLLFLLFLLLLLLLLYNDGKHIHMCTLSILQIPQRPDSQTPQLHREFMKTAAFMGYIYWVTGLLSILPEGTMGVDPEFGGPVFPQKWTFSPFLQGRGIHE